MFNANNSSGDLTSNDLYYKVLRLAVSIGIIVAIKRLIVGIMLSRQTFIHYGEELTNVMKSMVLVSEIATLSRLPLPRDKLLSQQSDEKYRERKLFMLNEEESQSTKITPNNALELPDLGQFMNGTSGDKVTSDPDMNGGRGPAGLPEPQRASVGTRSEITKSQRQLIMDLLERWEDPERVNREMVSR